MNLKALERIENWKGKPKELVIFLTENAKKDPAFFGQLIEILKTGSDPQRGTTADIIEQISTASPGLAAPFLDVIVQYLNYKAPRVKWGMAESIGNLSKHFPKKQKKQSLTFSRTPKTKVPLSAGLRLSH